MTEDNVLKLVVETLRVFRSIDPDSPPETIRIYGDGQLDSMGLVIFLAELEARLFDETGTCIVLASDRAMSRSHSPYRSAGTLATFIIELLRDDKR
jgi:hypothetical protein